MELASPIEMRALVPEELARRLATVGPNQGVLLKSRTNPGPWLPPGWQGWSLVDGPSAWIIGLVPQGVRPVPLFDPLRVEHAQVGCLYRLALELAGAGQAEALEIGLRLQDHLETHLQTEEKWLFPLALPWLDARVLRELAYEHQGVRAGLSRLPQVLQSRLDGSATRKELEKFELDFFHMFEHHQQNEEGAIFPWLERVAGAALEPALLHFQQEP